jgi:hypothetical protein
VSLIPNLFALKHLALFNFDAQCCQQYAAKVFHRSQNQTEFSNAEYKELCRELSEIIKDVLEDLAVLKACIPSHHPEGEG